MRTTATSGSLGTELRARFHHTLARNLYNMYHTCTTCTIRADTARRRRAARCTTTPHSKRAARCTTLPRLPGAHASYGARRARIPGIPEKCPARARAFESKYPPILLQVPGIPEFPEIPKIPAAAASPWPLLFAPAFQAHPRNSWNSRNSALKFCAGSTHFNQDFVGDSLFWGRRKLYTFSIWRFPSQALA